MIRVLSYIGVFILGGVIGMFITAIISAGDRFDEG